jgi:hypothetical protein
VRARAGGGGADALPDSLDDVFGGLTLGGGGSQQGDAADGEDGGCCLLLLCCCVWCLPAPGVPQLRRWVTG